MIRRWSHIIKINAFSREINKFEKKLKIVAFKSSVNFKRFSFKITKFKRKSMARFKHTANWFIYTNSIKFWSIDYLFSRNFFKTQFFNHILIAGAFCYNFNSIKIRNDLLTYNCNFFLSTLSKKFFFYYNKYSFSLCNSPLSIIWYEEFPNTEPSFKLSFNSWDDLFYPINSNPSGISTFNFFNLDNIFILFFDLNLIYFIEVKKILTLLYFFNLNFKNVK